MFKRAAPDMIARARALRRNATDAEKRLWWKLRELNALGFRFRRQAPFHVYVLDFAEHDARLVIELDGSQHAEAVHHARDERRDEFLASQGYRTLRFWNREIDENIDSVVERIVAMLPALEHRPPPARLRRTTSPQKGR
ncbi:MAG: endonuclease domain-containing protein [Rhizomicrobium sp.]